MTGGKNYAQISMRFSMADMSGQPGGGLHSSEVQYRRKPPSAVGRDERRRQQWQNVRDNNKEGTNRNTFIKTQVQSENKGDIVTHIPPDIDTSRSGSARNIATPELPQTDLNDVFTQVENDNMGASCKQSGHDIPTEKAAEADDSFDTGYVCDICSKDLKGNTWYRCTRCVSDDKLNYVEDLCKECLPKHSHHEAYIQEYVYPSDSDLYSCQSCGAMFTDNRTRISKCTVCKFYIMCTKCKNKGRHGHHQDKMQKVTRGRLKTVAGN